MTLSLSRDLWNDNLTNLSLEIVKFDKKLLRRDSLIRVLKY